MRSAIRAFLQLPGLLIMAGEIEEIWNEAKMDLDTTQHLGENFQRLVEQTIGNLAALRLLDESDDEVVKNS